MRYVWPWFVVAMALGTGPARSEEAASRVSVPLSEYEALKKSLERSSVTVVDTLRLSGSFGRRDLHVVLSGRSAGTLPPVDVIANAAGIVIFGCDGDGILSRGGEGVFRLTPLAGRFAVRCRLATRGSDRLEMWSTPPVLWVESDVVDGEFVLGQESADGGRQFSVVRRVQAATERLKPSATGRYRIALRPDETGFEYRIQVHNPNRSRQTFDVVLSSGEHVQQVDAQVPYDVRESRYRFDIPPGEAELTLSGSLPGGRFVPPIEASLQYALLESHPLLRPVVGGQPKRVSPQEVGIPTQYRGAQAFILAGGDALTWETTRLQALRTTSFAVSRAQHVFFLSTDGPALGESDISIDNQGAPDISLPFAAEPTFASLQGEPVLLTKNAKGDLWLPIAQGAQQLVVQHRQTFRRIPGFAWAQLVLPRLPVPATNAYVTLRYPAEYFPLYESFLSEARVWTPDAGAIVAWLLMFVFTERVLAGLGLLRRPRLVLAASLALAALAWGWALVVLFLADLAVAVVVAIPWIRSRRWAIGGILALLLAAGFVFLIAVVAIPSLMRARVSAPYSSAEYDEGRADKPAAAAAAEGPARAEQYQGLPAKFEMPQGARQTSFSRELLDTDTSRAARVVMISQTLLGWLQSVVVLAAVVLLWRRRRTLIAGWNARLAAIRLGPEKTSA